MASKWRIAAKTGSTYTLTRIDGTRTHTNIAESALINYGIGGEQVRTPEQVRIANEVAAREAERAEYHRAVEAGERPSKSSLTTKPKPVSETTAAYLEQEGVSSLSELSRTKEEEPKVTTLPTIELTGKAPGELTYAEPRTFGGFTAPEGTKVLAGTVPLTPYGHAAQAINAGKTIFGSRTIWNILKSKPVKIAIPTILGATGIVSWLASDNILTGTTFTMRKLTESITDADSKQEALAAAPEVQGWIDTATSFVNIATMINPLLWPFRKIFMINAAKAQVDYDLELEKIQSFAAGKTVSTREPINLTERGETVTGTGKVEETQEPELSFAEEREASDIAARERELKEREEDKEYFEGIEEKKQAASEQEREEDKAYYEDIAAKKRETELREREEDKTYFEDRETKRRNQELLDRAEDVEFWEGEAAKKRALELIQMAEDTAHFKQIADDARARKLKQRAEDEAYWAKIKGEALDNEERKMLEAWNAGKSSLNFKWLGL